ncbi:MAG TPA: hydantoinase B/oxoprolinase family protein [Candidatus Binatia bacterium]|nr:hydantoinase B/oxoprolinase family protein [Candidatus Binatia bacterium]
MAQAKNLRLNPVKYETFLHRLWAIGEEGRTSIQRVTASPIVSQGGECMASFYTADGTMILACSGHLRFAAATSDAIKRLIEWFAKSPGFFAGDQFFFNDPYIAGAHTFDMMIIKPVFYRSQLVAWVSSSIHTADTGGVLRGLASEVYHEGIRIQGLKIVEKGEFREDVFRSLTQQCRDPEYVGLDLKSQIASNNVCGKRYNELIEKLGLDFVRQAGDKMIVDSERLARSRLRNLPDGKWFSRVFGTAWDRREGKVKEYQIVCAMSKKRDDLLLDFTGTSPEMTDSTNSTLAGTIAQIAVVMTDFLFWDVPWSDGRLRPVKIHVPEGSILNCTFPAACGEAPAVGVQAKIAVSDCIARMLYGAGEQDINAPWQGVWYTGGPGFFYGGHNREGIPVAQGLYDGHGAGLGATPKRDGVHCGGNMNIPSGGISDVERIEMQYPFLYFTRNLHLDGGGAGKLNGGTGSFRIYMIYGSQDCSVSYRPYSRLPEGVGLFGGNPAGIGGIRAVYQTAGASLMERLKTGHYPIQPNQIEKDGWGTVDHPAEIKGRVNLPEFTIVADFVAGGGGYGDPLEREPDAVTKDVRRGIVSPRLAAEIYGVVLNQSSSTPDAAATSNRRQKIRETRILESQPFSGSTSSLSDAVRRSTAWQTVLKFHEYLAIERNGTTEAIRCSRCGHLFCEKHENYKLYAPRRERNLYDLARSLVPSGESYLGGYLEYCCPGCATLLQVDSFCDAFPDSKEPFYDFHPEP